MTPLLECRGLTVRFGGVVAIGDLSLSIERAGEVVGLVGPNGSGKSTFLNAISGLVPAQGQVEVEGRAVPLGRPGAIARHGVFRTYQTPQVDQNVTCLENILVTSPDTRLRGLIGAWPLRPAMWRQEKLRWQDACDALARVGLLDKANLGAGGLSYGERRRLEIARALMAGPRLLLMDEPAAGLNTAETDRLAVLLAGAIAEGVSLIVVEHKIAFIEQLCQRIVVLELGRQIASGPPKEVWLDPAVMDAYLGEAV
ncbi:MAG TPA: ATP-binding cassette domain-containing protein [Acidimicrobiales bacterium]|nr:ATP-binding cassette domain-containing protein [Acidimicrobiales bacterium]